MKWKHVSEVGSLWGMYFLIGISRILGRLGVRMLLYPITLYYMIGHHTARRASIAYLRRIGQPTTLISVFRHFLTFAQCTLDKIFFLRGDFQRFTIVRSGSENLQRLRQRNQGAILLSAHLGAPEALRSSGVRDGHRINIVTFSGNARRINHIMDKLNPNARSRMVELAEDTLGAVFQIQELVEHGELVAIMGDRTGFGAVVGARFLGTPIELPIGPYMLASIIGCPIYFTVGLYMSANRYQYYCETFAERIEIPRKNREASLAMWAQRYADRVEHYCRIAPYNWFNFYDLWSKP
ncbi:MAG: hypothetical protein H6715_03340 [Myxococcales bacterium]|nr:hypothetical protein [Myxococcales bacterium]MCB9708881.1 hypothetical protein [Myxococcales bacterium]